MKHLIDRLLQDGERTRDRIANAMLVAAVVLILLTLLNSYVYL